MFETDINKLREIDYWSPEMYQSYYSKIMPFFKRWYPQKEGYRPVVMGRNISWWLARGEFIRKCNIKCCNENDNMHKILSQAGNDKMACWVCEFDHKKELSSGWERYYNIFARILWDINMIEKRPGILSTIRSFYWQPAIRFYELVDKPTNKSWNEISAMNLVLDIDIIDKNKKSIFDKDIWDTFLDMLVGIGGVLESEDIEYKIQFSGNGVYFITKKIIEREERQGELTREIFWNIISSGWSSWVNKEIKKLEEVHTNFTIDGRQPYTMMFIKTPFSLHQRLDVSAIPISIDMVNGMSNKEFEEVCKPEYVADNVDELLKVWI